MTTEVLSKFHQKLKCGLHPKCVAYTFEQSRLTCILHSSTNRGQRHRRGKQTGVKKSNYLLSLLEISYCSNKNRKRRCRSEPKCLHKNCFRNALECLEQQSFNCLGHILELYCREKGFDAGFIRDEYGCILERCECAHFSQTVIGKII